MDGNAFNFPDIEFPGIFVSMSIGVSLRSTNNSQGLLVESFCVHLLWYNSIIN